MQRESKFKSITVRLTGEDADKLEALRDAYQVSTVSEAVRNLIRYTDAKDASFQQEVIRPVQEKVVRLVASDPEAALAYIESEKYTLDTEALTKRYLLLYGEEQSTYESDLEELRDLTKELVWLRNVEVREEQTPEGIEQIRRTIEAQTTGRDQDDDG